MLHTGVKRRAMDVTSDKSVQDTIEEVIATEGRLDIVVNNAGVICIGTFASASTRLFSDYLILFHQVLSLTFR